MPHPTPVLAFLFSLATTAAAQASSWLVKSWDSDDGLPQNSVVALAQTGDGMLWAGTLLGGIASFDGERFTSYSPTNTPALQRLETFALSTAPDGRLWVAQLGGALATQENGGFIDVTDLGMEQGGAIERFLDSKENVPLLAVRQDGFVLQRTGVADWEVLDLPRKLPDTTRFFERDSSGRLYFRNRENRGSLGWWENGETGVLSLSTIPGETVLAMESSPEGAVWIATESGIGEIRGGTILDRTPAGGSNPTIQIAFAGDGAPWVRAPSGLRRYENGTWGAVAEGIPGLNTGAGPTTLFDFLPAPDGGLWVIGRHEGAWHVDRGGMVSHPDASDGLPGGLVESGLVDREGNLWLGFNGGGLARVQRRFLELLETPSGPPPVVRSICEDATGALWTGHSEGQLVQWFQDRRTEWNLPAGGETGGSSAARDVVAWPDHAGNLWVGTVGNGAWLLRDGVFTRPFPSAATGTVVRAGLCDRDGRIWMGSEHGLFLYQEGLLRRLTPAADGFTGRYVLALEEGADGAIWAGTAEGVLWRSLGGVLESWSLPGEHEFRFWSILADDDGTVWIGTLAGGLLRWRDGELRRATATDGLPSNTVTQLLDDEDGNLWAGSRHGLFSLEKKQLDAFYAGKIERLRPRTFTLADGMPAMECSGGFHPGCLKASDGKLWFATVKGAVAVVPDNIPFNPLPPTVLVEGFSVDGIRHDLADTKLSPGRRSLVFRFTATSLTAPEKVRFQWRLDGLEPTWVDGGMARSVRYNLLEPGRFEFRVRACNNDGIWNETGTSLAFSIAPHYWQRLWFRTAAFLAALTGCGFALWAVLHRRHRREIELLARKEALYAERQRIARDLHDDLGASLTQLNWMCDTKDTPHRDIGAKARSMVRSIDEIIWAINPRNDTVDGLAHYICQFAEDFLSETGIRCRLDVDDPLPESALASNIRHDAFLIAREAIHNAARHSDAEEIRIAIRVTPGHTIVKITDDGVGFDPDCPPPGSGNGLRNMEARAAALDTTLELESAPGRGCRISFRVAT